MYVEPEQPNSDEFKHPIKGPLDKEGKVAVLLHILLQFSIVCHVSKFCALRFSESSSMHLRPQKGLATLAIFPLSP